MRISILGIGTFLLGLAWDTGNAGRRVACLTRGMHFGLCFPSFFLSFLEWQHVHKTVSARESFELSCPDSCFISTSVPSLSADKGGLSRANADCFPCWLGWPRMADAQSSCFVLCASYFFVVRFLSAASVLCLGMDWPAVQKTKRRDGSALQRVRRALDRRFHGGGQAITAEREPGLAARAALRGTQHETLL